MKLLIIALLTTLSVTSYAQENGVRTVLSQKTVNLKVDISKTKLKLSGAGYFAPVVKVLIPELADVTILNHRNIGEAAPCLATYEAATAEEVIQNNPAIENIDFEITLEKLTVPDSQTGICEVSLTENISGVIRGFLFTHSRTMNVPKRSLGDCR